MGFNSEGNVGWTRTASYLTKGEGSHTFLSAASLCPLSASRFPGPFAHPNELFCVGRTPENSGSCFSPRFTRVGFRGTFHFKNKWLSFCRSHSYTIHHVFQLL